MHCHTTCLLAASMEMPISNLCGGFRQLCSLRCSCSRSRGASIMLLTRCRVSCALPMLHATPGQPRESAAADMIVLGATSVSHPLSTSEKTLSGDVINAHQQRAIVQERGHHAATGTTVHTLWHCCIVCWQFPARECIFDDQMHMHRLLQSRSMCRHVHCV